MQPQSLKESSARYSEAILEQTITAIRLLTARSRRISFYTVAKEAQVARSTLYRRADLRKLVETARSKQIDTTLNPENPYEKIAQLKEALQRAEQQNRALKEALANKQSITYAFIHPSDAA